MTHVFLCVNAMAMAASSALSSVSIVPVSCRPGYDTSVETKRDCICVYSIGPMFHYKLQHFTSGDTSGKSEGIL